MADLKSGVEEVRAPVYSHLRYDIVEGETLLVRTPTSSCWRASTCSSAGGRVYVSDFVDFALYLDAEEADVRHWYLERFLELRNGAFQKPESYFHRYARLSDDEAIAVAEGSGATNRPNLLENISPRARERT